MKGTCALLLVLNAYSDVGVVVDADVDVSSAASFLLWGVGVSVRACWCLSSCG